MSPKRPPQPITPCPLGRVEDLKGQTFGALHVEQFAGKRGRTPCWTCRCVCGQTRQVAAHNLKSGASRSCGCVAASLPNRHGQRSSPEYAVWRRIRRNAAWKNFTQFLACVGARPSGKHVLCRPDPQRPFGPDNAIWTTVPPSRSGAPRFEFAGETHTLSEWAERLGISRQALHLRLRRYPLETALSLGKQQGGPLPLDQRARSSRRS